MEGCNEVVDANMIKADGAIMQNVSDMPMVIFLPPNQTPEQDPNMIISDVNSEQNLATVSSDVTLIQNYSDVATLDGSSNNVTWLGCPSSSQDQLLYVTFANPAEGENVQPMLLQVTHQAEQYYTTEEKSGGEESEEEDEEEEQETEIVCDKKKNKHSPWQSIADDVNIETKLQVLEAMLPSMPRATPQYRRPETDDKAVYACDLCQATFSRAHQYYGHLHTHTGERVWACDTCPLKFMSHSMLRKHEKIHMNLRPHVCGLCGLQFDRESQLQYHERRIHLQERSHRCQFCMKGFFKRSDLRSHLNIHLGIRKNICETCGRQFNHRSNLKRHSRIHTGIKPYVCSICGLRFIQVNALNAHKLQHHPVVGPAGVPSYECGDCGKVLKTMAMLKRHIMLMHGAEIKLPDEGKLKIRQYYCQICGDSFQFAALLQQHEIDAHENQIDFFCKNCCQRFEKSSDMKNHSCGANPVAKDSEDLLKCDPKNLKAEADANSLQLESLIDQSLLDILSPSEDLLKPRNKPNDAEMVIYIQTEGQKEPTAVRIKYDTNYDQESTHIEINENSQLPEINFPISNVNDDNSRFSLLSVASSKSDDELLVSKEEMAAIDAKKAEELVDSILEREPLHLVEEVPVVVKQKKSFDCKECGKVFNKKSNYTQHLGLHNVDLKKYRCSHCGCTYAWKSSLNKHLQSAHGVNVEPGKMACTMCTKHFTNATQLQEHLKRDHYKQRNNVCSVCNKGFYKKADLQVHMRTHSKEKPYMCGTCGKAFSHVSHIIRHERIHNGIKPYTCEVCGKGFNQSTTLKMHRQRHFEPKTPKSKVPRTPKSRAQGKIMIKNEPSVSSSVLLNDDGPSTVDLQMWTGV